MPEFCTYIKNNAPDGLPAHLELQIEILGGLPIGPKGEIFVTPPMVTAAEVHKHIGFLIDALEKVRVEALGKLEENECS